MLRYQNENDETLVMLTLAGEQSAYEVLVVRYQRAVVASAYSVVRNQFISEDAAQDAFVTAWMKLNTLRQADKYGSWVCRIAKNCAVNMAKRFHSYLPLDAVDNLDIDTLSPQDAGRNPAEVLTLSEQNAELYQGIGKLPEKIKKIIHLYYFEGLSVAQIAEKMALAEGTVKWQLHDGRKRIRKEFSAMNEKYDDTLVQRVMKKVEELKLWQLRNDKSGFDAVYKDVLRDVEELPESQTKSHALADVLLCGWWWLPGEANDALFSRIEQSALEGKNEEAMTFIISREDSKMGYGYNSAKIEFIRDKQIPKLEKAGFQKTLGREWFWLAYYYFRDGKPELGNEAYDRAERILHPCDAYYSLIPYCRELEKILASDYRDVSSNMYCIGPCVDECRYKDGALRFWKQEEVGEGELGSYDRDADDIFRISGLCDGMFFADVGLGETYTGTDGTTLTYMSDSETVVTPAGTFEGCRLWITRHVNDQGKSVGKSYYKDGVGIVKFEHICDGLADARLLSSYHIAGGEGLIPAAEGNTWEYASNYAPDAIRSELRFEVTFADAEKVMFTSRRNVRRLKYDENIWAEMVQQISNDYWTEENGKEKLHDVTHAVERAGALAKTPMEKAYTKAASSVIRRIMDTDNEQNPDCTATGHWNFFEKLFLHKKGGALRLTGYNGRWSFEWKCGSDMDMAEQPILYNDIYGILQDAANCIWSEEWQPGASPVVEYPGYNKTIRTKITCENCESVTTKAGTFDDCLRLTLDIGGMTDGWFYRGGEKVYYFASGVGIVRTENLYGGGARTAVYELTAYEGRGEGYMPFADGMMRRYDAIGLTDGFVASAVYTYVADDDGDIVIFSDRTGIRELPPPITEYNAIESEREEERLWDADKRDECRLLHDVNNFRLMLHFLARRNYNLCAPQRNAVWQKYRISLIETFRDGGELPRAWWGAYADAHFITACTLFGCNTPREILEEGYEYLEKAFELYPKWLEIPDGELLETGNVNLFGGIRLKKGNDTCLILPDGRAETVSNGWFLSISTAGRMLSAMTAPHGWEWFESVRGEERFKQYIARAKALTDEK